MTDESGQSIDANTAAVMQHLEQMAVPDRPDYSYTEMIRFWQELGESLDIQRNDLPFYFEHDGLGQHLRFFELRHKHVSAHPDGNPQFARFWHELTLAALYWRAGDEAQTRHHCLRAIEIATDFTAYESMLVCPSQWLRLALLAGQACPEQLEAVLQQIHIRAPRQSLLVLEIEKGNAPAAA